MGEISGGKSGIYNDRGGLETLNNAQGGDGSTEFNTALTYRGVLPNKYNMIAYGDRYGQLAVDNSSFVIRDPETGDVLEPIDDGSLTFGIFGGDAENGVAPTQLKRQTYLNVMTGVEVSDIDNTWA